VGKTSIQDFVLAPRFEGTPRYRLYVDSADAARIDRFAQRFEAAICAVNSEYADKRKSLRLAGVELVCVPDGYLRERDARLRQSRSRTAEQFKHQYLLPRPNMDDDLATGATRFAAAG
jgi:hypothetical protein